MNNGRINWDKTELQVKRILRRTLRPWHYKELFEESAVWDHTQQPYSEKTDPVEKFRQHYAEHDRPVKLIPGTRGYLVFEDWFPSNNVSQLWLWAPPSIEIKANRVEALEAGMELARRIPYMVDHFKDADSKSRQDKRKRGALVEADVKAYFKKHYPEFYRPASNKNQYEKPAPDDFSLVLPKYTLAIDVKSDSYEENGQSYGVVRNVKDWIYYLFATWHNKKATQLHGILSGKRVKSRGNNKGALIHIPYNRTLPIECLIVMLNMAKAGLDYNVFYKNLYSN